MIRSLLEGLVILGCAAVALIQLDIPLSVIAWEIVVLAALVTVGWRRWPRRPRKTTSLMNQAHRVDGRQPNTLASLELEIAAATDPRLAGDRVLRHRLLSLLHHRAGLPDGPVEGAHGRRIIGDAAWAALVEEEGPMDPDTVDELVGRIEAI